MAQGHPDAWDYPLAFMWNEARIARDRINGQTATEATLLFQTIQAVWSGKVDNFKRSIEGLIHGNE